MMEFCRLRFTVICVCRAFLGWLLKSKTTTISYRLLTISLHLLDDIKATIPDVRQAS